MKARKLYFWLDQFLGRAPRIKIFVFILLILGCLGNLPAIKAEKGIEVTILYDNYIHTDGTKSDWGFSCLIEGTEKTILFDAGTKSDILWHNIKELNVDINKIDLVVISHLHGDHFGGLFSFLSERNDVPVYIPIPFPEGYSDQFEKTGAKAIVVNQPQALCKNVFSTGKMGVSIAEQSLILDTSKGLVVITGCAHPGIVDIVKKARIIGEKNIDLVFGGFHLMQNTPSQVQDIIKQFNSLGVGKCGATHCTGDQSIEIFKKAYGKNYVGMRVGKIVHIEN